jgi:hypothetical protein
MVDLFQATSKIHRLGFGKVTMSIRLIAKDLYHFQKEVEKIEKQIENASYEKRVEMKDQLRKARAERDRIRRMLNGCLEK